MKVRERDYIDVVDESRNATFFHFPESSACLSNLQPDDHQIRQRTVNQRSSRETHTEWF